MLQGVLKLSLIEAVEKFLLLPYECKAEMGRAGRLKMEKEFDRNIVIEAYLKEIKKQCCFDW